MKRLLIAYLLIVTAPALAAVALIVPIGATAPGGAAPAVADASTLPRLLVAIAVVVGAAAVGGALAERLGQARVFGELIAGLLLGPTALGAALPGLQQWLFPKNILPQLDSMAQLGVVFFMFLVGMEVSHTDMRRISAKAIVIGHAAIAVPFLGGVATAWWLYHRYPPAHSGSLSFALFIGVAFAITAFPVLARILDEQHLLSTRLGSMGIGAAGACDLTAWCLLAVVVTVVHHTSLLPALVAIATAVAFTIAMITIVRTALVRLVAQADRNARSPIALYAGLVCVVLVSALVTEAIGVHPIFGAFLAGIIMPRGSATITDLGTKLEGLTLWVLLPLFFVTVGLRTDIGAVTGVSALAVCSVIVAVALTTKVIGSGAAALAVGESRRDALAVAIMMNCRGLTELVVLNLGLQLGLLDSALFAMFVIMALITTGVTAPALRAIVGRRPGSATAAQPSTVEPAH
ncbi:cation:proton antiporter [Nocardia nepalensis]|uniref:cation:proton antiporter domain-containing protein n=1 Tax=Nocardia nepalensis TaxID=3375448 RepID=UPI003B67D9D8